MYFKGGDDDDKKTAKPDEGGPNAGQYQETDPNTPIPGETEGIDNSQLGG